MLAMTSMISLIALIAYESCGLQASAGGITGPEGCRNPLFLSGNPSSPMASN